MNQSKLTKTDKIIANVLTVATGVIAVYTSFSFRDIFATLYGENSDLPFITKAALNSYIWAPVILGLALVAFHRTAKRKPDSKRSYLLLLCLEMVIIALISYGFWLPLSQTTFEMAR